MTLPVAILAGGLATRLGHLSKHTPKSLLTVAGKPFLFWQLEWLRSQGTERVVLCVGHLGNQIEDAVCRHRSTLHVDFSYDGAQRLGTGGALKRAMPLLGERFLVLYGDSYLTCSLPEIERAFKASRRLALMTVFRNEGRWDTSNVLYSNGQVLRFDKKAPSSDMKYIDYGLNGLSAEVFERYRFGDQFDLADVFATLARAGELAAHESTERFYEIGSPSGMTETDLFLSRKVSHDLQ